MAIDYYVQFPCPVREQVSDADLLRMEKSRNRLNALRHAMQQDPGHDSSRPEEEWSCVIRVMGPEGPLDRRITLGELSTESAPLAKLSVHCQRCPANLGLRDFGCGGAIGYPITAQAERWLLSRLPSDLSSPVGQSLVRAIADFGFDGARVDAARGRQELYELERPVERTWGGLLSKKTRITSSQVLQMLIYSGSLSPAQAKLMAYFLGFLDDSFKVVALPPNGDGDERTCQFIAFLKAAAFAGERQAPVLLDA